MAEKCDKCGGKTTKGRHHKHCRACVNCTVCGWSNTHDMMFKDWRTPSGASMGYGAESFEANEDKIVAFRYTDKSPAHICRDYGYTNNTWCGQPVNWDRVHYPYHLTPERIDEYLGSVDNKGMITFGPEARKRICLRCFRSAANEYEAESFEAEDCSICGGVYGDYLCECDVPMYAESFEAEGICICGSSCNCDCGCAESGVCNCGPSCPCSCGCGVANAESVTKNAEMDVAGVDRWVKSTKDSLDELSNQTDTWIKSTRTSIGELENSLGRDAETFEALGKPDAPYDEGYKDELDESLGERDGAESTKSQSKGSRRRESMGTERSMGRRPYSGVRTMDAEGNPKKTTSTLYARFYVGHTDKKGELAGNGKFKSYDDALAKAKEVAKKEGHSRIVSTRGFALWTSDGQGLFQAGKSTAEAKKFYRAEDGSIDMNGYATEYMEAEDGFFEAVGDDYRTSMKRSNPLSIHYIPPGSPVKPTRPSDDQPRRRRPFKRPIRRPMNAHEDIEIQTDIQVEKTKQRHQARKERGIGFRKFLKWGKHSKGAEGMGGSGDRNWWAIGEIIMAGVLVVGYLNHRKKSS